jgi:hypothetical protein
MGPESFVVRVDTGGIVAVEEASDAAGSWWGSRDAESSLTVREATDSAATVVPLAEVVSDWGIKDVVNEGEVRAASVSFVDKVSTAFSTTGASFTELLISSSFVAIFSGFVAVDVLHKRASDLKTCGISSSNFTLFWPVSVLPSFSLCYPSFLFSQLLCLFRPPSQIATSAHEEAFYLV